MAENKNNEAEELEVQGVEVEESASEQFVENNAKKLGIIAGAAIEIARETDAKHIIVGTEH